MSNDMEESLQIAMDKCEEILSEFMDSGIIIGTFIDDDGHTRKWSQDWGNNFAVAKMLEVEVAESDIAAAFCSCAPDEDDD